MSRETGLTTQPVQSSEIAQSAAIAREQHRIQAAYVIAHQFPRDEMAVLEKLRPLCEIYSFADEALYKFPRGKKKVEGEDGREVWVDNIVTDASAYLARAIASRWSNFQYGFELVRDDRQKRGLRAFSCDLETNVTVTSEKEFEKKVQKKIYENKVHIRTDWIDADERQVEEITGKHGAIAERNCILRLIPRFIVADLKERCQATVARYNAANLDERIKKLPDAFLKINVTTEQIEGYLGHELTKCTVEDIAELQGAYRAIRDRFVTWDEFATGSYKHRGETEPPAEPQAAATAPAGQVFEADPAGAPAPSGEVKEQAAEPSKQPGPRSRELVTPDELAEIYQLMSTLGLGDADLEEFTDEFVILGPEKLRRADLDEARAWLNDRAASKAPPVDVVTPEQLAVLTTACVDAGLTDDEVQLVAGWLEVPSLADLKPDHMDRAMKLIEIERLLIATKSQTAPALENFKAKTVAEISDEQLGLWIDGLLVKRESQTAGGAA